MEPIQREQIDTPRHLNANPTAGQRVQIIRNTPPGIQICPITHRLGDKPRGFSHPLRTPAKTVASVKSAVQLR